MMTSCRVVMKQMQTVSKFIKKTAGASTTGMSSKAEATMERKEVINVNVVFNSANYAIKLATGKGIGNLKNKFFDEALTPQKMQDDFYFLYKDFNLHDEKFKGRTEVFTVGLKSKRRCVCIYIYMIYIYMIYIYIYMSFCDIFEKDHTGAKHTCNRCNISFGTL